MLYAANQEVSETMARILVNMSSSSCLPHTQEEPSAVNSCCNNSGATTMMAFDRTADTHITRPRKKLGPLGEKIVTVWGVGYRFVH